MRNILHAIKNYPFFRGLTNEEILSVLECTGAKKKKVKAKEYLLRTGEKTTDMGLVLSGSLLIVQEDLWGNRNIMNKIKAGDFFGEAFASVPGATTNISVVADEDSLILMMNINKLLTVCHTACDHHNMLVRNLVSVLANKVLMLNNKVTHMSKRTTKDKLLSYLSAEAVRQNKLSFDIHFDRQQLADFLGVERAAMSVELSKLQKEGLLTTKRSHFNLNAHLDI